MALLHLWHSFIAFLTRIFTRSSKSALPQPVTARPPSASLRVSDTPLVKDPAPLKLASSAAPSTDSPTPALSDPDRIFHPSFPNMSFSGIFATPDIRLGPFEHSSIVSPGSPSPFRSSHTPPSFHTLHPWSPRTPRTPSSPVIVHIDRSTFSPTTMSDGSLEVISLPDRRAFLASPLTQADIGPLPSPWSPTGKKTSSDVWLAVDGTLMNATGPVDAHDDAAASRTPTLASLTLSRISASSLYSSSSALDAFGISVFVNLDNVGDPLSSQASIIDSRHDPITLNHVHDENRPTRVTTPRKRRETLPSVTRSCHSSRATKCLSTPLTKLDNAEISHVKSVSSVSSMAYEFRLGLFAEGKSMTAIENIISMLDQASPESMRPQHDAMKLVEIV